MTSTTTSTTTSTAGKSLRRRLPVSLAVLLTGVATVAGLAPGGLGEPDPVIVDDGTSVAVHRLLVVTGGPAWAHGVLENAGAVGLLLLGGLLVATWWRGRGEARVLAGVLLTAAATVAAFLTSEALKQVVDEQRPCRVPGLPAVPDCPGVGDWSFPSNHATLAAALAIGIVLVRPRLGALAGRWPSA